jgi:hypothetical protein
MKEQKLVANASNCCWSRGQIEANSAVIHPSHPPEGAEKKLKKKGNVDKQD